MSIQYNAKPDFQTQEKLIRFLDQKYSFLNIKCESKSLCKRNIYSLNLGDCTNNPVIFVGAFHGLEWLTTLLLFKFCETLCDSILNNSKIQSIDVKKFLQIRGLIIIPCLNPDGVEISLHGPTSAGPYKDLVKSVCLDTSQNWQANARGVDLNHNFDAHWDNLHLCEHSQGITGPSPTRYGGPHPQSEPESQFLTSFCLSNKFRHAIAFHSQGEEIYWEFGESTPSKSKKLANIMSKTSGYKLSFPHGLAVGGGFKDWVIEKLHKPAFTVEIGKGSNPLALSKLDDIYSTLEKMLLLTSIL